MAPSSLNCLPALQPGRAPMPQLSSVSHPSWPGSPAPGPVQTASAAAGGSLLRACPWPPQRLGRPKRSKVRTGRIDSAWNRCWGLKRQSWRLDAQGRGVGRAGSFCEGETAPGPSPASGGLLAVFGVPWLLEASPHLCLRVLMAFSLCLCVFT